MNLKSYVPGKHQVQLDAVSISKSHSLIFYSIMAEKLGIKDGQYAELLFDTDELAASGKVSKIYVRIYTEKPKNVPVMQMATNGQEHSKSIQINVQGLMKQIKYPHTAQKYYKAYPHEISGVEYIAIDLLNPIVELEREEE